MIPTIQATPQGAMIEGALTVQYIPSLMDAGYAVIDASSGPVVMDLSRVTAVDSASLALLIDWIRYAKRAQKCVKFMHLPEKIQQMMQLSNLQFP